MAALEKCPHMTARCPHFRTDCSDSTNKDCHYIKRTTASMVTAVSSLHTFGFEKLSPTMLKYLQETENFLKEIGISLKK